MTDPELTKLQAQIEELARRMTAGEAERQALADRTDAIEARADIDREMIHDLQSEGVLRQEHARELEEALRSSRVIGAALGILMASRGVNEDQAFHILKKASQNGNRKLREVAAALVAAQTRDDRSA